MKTKKYSGFTLIEILVVVGLIAILAAITIIAINPAKNFAQTRDAQRSTDITAILNAITQYTSEEGNTLSGLITATHYGDPAEGNNTLPTCPLTAQILNQRGAVALDAADYDLGVDLFTVLVDGFLVAIPEDPSQAVNVGVQGRDTFYEMCQTAGGRVTVIATPERSGTTITVSR